MMQDAYSDAYDDGYGDGCSEGRTVGWDNCKVRAIEILEQEAKEAEVLHPGAALFIRYAITALRNEL